MTGQQNQEEALIQNLEDAGCTSDVIDSFIHEILQARKNIRAITDSDEAKKKST